MTIKSAGFRKGRAKVVFQRGGGKGKKVEKIRGTGE